MGEGCEERGCHQTSPKPKTGPNVSPNPSANSNSKPSPNLTLI